MKRYQGLGHEQHLQQAWLEAGQQQQQQHLSMWRRLIPTGLQRLQQWRRPSRKLGGKNARFDFRMDLRWMLRYANKDFGGAVL